MLMAVATGPRKICEILQLLWILGSTLALGRNQTGLVVSSRGEDGSNVPENELAYVSKWMKKTIDDLKGSWLKVSTSMNKSAQTGEDKIDKMRTSIMHDVEKEVNKLEQEARDAKLDIRECLKEVQDGGETMANSLLRRAMQCISVEADKSKQLVSIEEALEKEVNTTWQDVRRGWDNCQSSPNVIGCINRLVADAEIKEGNFSSKEGQMMSEASILANKLLSDTEYCITSELSTIPAQLAGKFSLMEDCVKKLLIKKNST